MLNLIIFVSDRSITKVVLSVFNEFEKSKIIKIKVVVSEKLF